MGGNALLKPTTSESFLCFVEAAAEWKTARQLAAALGISLRSVYRYIDLARRYGYTVRTHNGTGGGVQVLGKPTAFTPPKTWTSWRVCPYCATKTTKMFSINTGLFSCQLCNGEYVSPWDGGTLANPKAE